MKKLSLEELNRPSVDTYKSADKLPVTIVLDNIRSALNVGSVFRTVDGFGMERILLCGISAQPPHKEINKAAIGATQSVDWLYYADEKEAILKLKEDGYTIIGIEQTDKAVLLSDYQVPRDTKLAFVLGNEVEGISDAVLPLLDIALEVPQFGTKHSFNVSVCTGIVLWEISKQLRS